MSEHANSEANPLTHAHQGNRGWSWCKCSECGAVAVCTPARDFYTRDACDGQPASDLLVCDSCINGPLKRLPDMIEPSPGGRN